jgi:acyl carrier protein
VACSYNGTTSVCFVTDAALPGLDRLPGLFRDAVEELPHPHDDSQLPDQPPHATETVPTSALDCGTTAIIDFALIKDILVQQGSLPAAPITAGATQAQAGIDSLAIALLSMTLEDRMGVVIAEHELAKAPTVADLVNLVAQRAASLSDHESPGEQDPHPQSPCPLATAPAGTTGATARSGITPATGQPRIPKAKLPLTVTRTSNTEKANR